MTDQLTAVLDRFVADQHPALPPVADVRRRANQRRRRRFAVTSTAVLVTALLTAGGLWAIRGNREPGILVIADSEVRLNDWATLTWLPDDIVSVQFDGTNYLWAMEQFGYWQGHYSLRRGLAQPITLRIALGDPFDVEAEHAMSEGSVVEGDRVRSGLEDGRQSIYARVGAATVQIVGDDPAVMHRILDGMVVDTPTVEIPGDPVMLASGEVDGVPWDLRVSTPTTARALTSAAPNGTCLILRVYTGGQGCMTPQDDIPRSIWLGPTWKSFVPIGPKWVLLSGATDAVAFEYTRPDGTTERVDALSAAPAPGVFAVVDAGSTGQITGVRVLAALGTVLAEQPLWNTTT
ncbi:MAG: hypothetical protein NTZ21_16910 [Actinobacteria bacterium]|nr:hypothetical protein [Actinomycetota bacterium]